MTILAIDPGPKESALVLLDGDKVEPLGIVDNETAVFAVFDATELGIWPRVREADVTVIERFEARGMPLAEESLETVFWTGRLFQACLECQMPVHRIKRSEVKLHLCGSNRAKDSNIRQAIIDRYGGKEKAIGKKANPGPLYGIKSHLWAALAVGLTFQDLHEQKGAA